MAMAHPVSPHAHGMAARKPLMTSMVLVSPRRGAHTQRGGIRGLRWGDSRLGKHERYNEEEEYVDAKLSTIECDNGYSFWDNVQACRWNADMSRNLCTMARDLRRGSKREGSLPFASVFMASAITRPLYTRFLVSMWHVYRALEYELGVHAPGTPSLRVVHDPHTLSRLPALEKDIELLLGTKDRAVWLQQEVSPAVYAYVAHLHVVAAQRPALLLAHALVRYLGDLFGGPKLRAKVMAALGIHGGHCVDATSFFRFEHHMESLAAYRDAFRARVDMLHMSETECDEVLEESNDAFDFNMDILAALMSHGEADALLHPDLQPRRQPRQPSPPSHRFQVRLRQPRSPLRSKWHQRRKPVPSLGKHVRVRDDKKHAHVRDDNRDWQVIAGLMVAVNAAFLALQVLHL